MSQPLVSVIIPAYNAEKTIEETIASIQAQTYSPLEIIIVDDGSTDRTPQILETIVKNHTNVSVIRQKNAGVAAARNAAIEASSGTYIAPIDADDLWHERRIELHVAALEQAGPNAAVAYSPFYIINENGMIRGKSYPYDISGDVFTIQLEKNLIGNGSGLTVRRDALKEVGGYSCMLREKGVQGCEDYMVQMMLAQAYHFIAVPLHLIGYRVYNGNMSSDYMKMLKSNFEVYDYLQAHFQPDALAMHAGKKALTIFYLERMVSKKFNFSQFRELCILMKKNKLSAFFICITLKILVRKMIGKFKYYFKQTVYFADKKGVSQERSFFEVSSSPIDHI